MEPWTGVLNATKESKPAWHYNAQEKKFNRKILGTEDCLRLNIFTKDVSKQRAAKQCLISLNFT